MTVAQYILRTTRHHKDVESRPRCVAYVARNVPHDAIYPEVIVRGNDIEVGWQAAGASGWLVFSGDDASLTMYRNEVITVYVDEESVRAALTPWLTALGKLRNRDGSYKL